MHNGAPWFTLEWTYVGDAEQLFECSENGCLAMFESHFGLQLHTRKSHGKQLQDTTRDTEDRWECGKCGDIRDSRARHNHAQDRHGVDWYAYPWIYRGDGEAHGCVIVGCFGQFTSHGSMASHTARVHGVTIARRRRVGLDVALDETDSGRYRVDWSDPVRPVIVPTTPDHPYANTIYGARNEIIEFMDAQISAMLEARSLAAKTSIDVIKSGGFADLYGQ